jgi:hypothetical protein
VGAIEDKEVSVRDDPLKNEFIKHVLKHRPNCVTAQLAKEVARLRRRIKELTKEDNEQEEKTETPSEE